MVKEINVIFAGVDALGGVWGAGERDGNNTRW